MVLLSGSRRARLASPLARRQTRRRWPRRHEPGGASPTPAVSTGTDHPSGDPATVAGVAGTAPADEAALLVRLDQAIAELKETPGALIPLLQITQGLFGYLPEPALQRIGRALNKSISEIAGVAGFYSFFSTTPRGRHTVRVCLGTACYVRGGKRVLETFKHTLGVDVGQTTPSRQFSLEVARCLGACGIAPACLVDNAVHQSIKPNQVPAILEKYG